MSRKRSRRLWTALAALKLAGALVVLMGCESPTGTEATVGSVVVTPAVKALTVGDTLALSARVLDLAGTHLEDRMVTWSVSDTVAARLSTLGGGAVLQARRAGTVTVTATVGGSVGRSEVTIRAPTQVTSVLVLPGASVLEVGQQRVFTARAFDADGAEIPGLPVTWINDSPAVIALSEEGVVTALAQGYGQVTARVAGVSASVALTVTAPEPGPPQLSIAPWGEELRAGQQGLLRAVLRSAAGDTLPLAGLTWSVAEGTALLVAPSQAEGFAVATAREPGTATIAARIDGLEARVVVRVTEGEAVGSMEMRPGTLLAEVGVPVTLGVHAWRPDGAFFADPEASWISSDPSIASVTGVGPRAVLHGLREGAVEITAAAGGVTTRAAVTVKVAGPVDRVVVSPSRGAVWAGSLYRMRAATLRSGGAELPGQPVTWSVEDTTVATIEADGLLHARTAGSTRVIARSGGRQGVAEIRVHPSPGDRMILDLEPNTGPAGEWRPAVALADTTWTDETGATRTAHRFLMGGTLEIDRTIGSRWTQELEVETVAILAGGSRVVARTLLTDRGTWTLDLFDPWHLRFHSSDRPGTLFEGNMPEAGRFLVRQALEGTSTRDFVWMLR